MDRQRAVLSLQHQMQAHSDKPTTTDKKQDVSINHNAKHKNISLVNLAVGEYSDSENQIGRGETPASSRHPRGSREFKPHLGQHQGVIICNLLIITVPMLRQYHIAEQRLRYFCYLFRGSSEPSGWYSFTIIENRHSFQRGKISNGPLWSIFPTEEDLCGWLNTTTLLS